jgi:AraC-like DNA-binding protein
MDTPRSSYDSVLIDSLALESCDEGVDPSVGARAQPIDELVMLAEQLGLDSTWNWLGALAALLKDIYRTSRAHQFSGTPSGDDAHRPVDSCEQAAAEATDQIPCIVQRYRALVSLNTALAKALSAIRTSLAHVDGVPPAARSSPRRGLTPWQERRAIDYLLSHLPTRISNAELAAACGLSQSYFVTAFRQATGETPHLCLLRYRVAKAKELLRGSMAIADIALACGFADQSHLTRVFTKQTGISPGEWRRERRHEGDRRDRPLRPGGSLRSKRSTTGLVGTASL